MKKKTKKKRKAECRVWTLVYSGSRIWYVLMIEWIRNNIGIRKTSNNKNRKSMKERRGSLVDS